MGMSTSRQAFATWPQQDCKDRTLHREPSGMRQYKTGGPMGSSPFSRPGALGLGGQLNEIGQRRLIQEFVDLVAHPVAPAMIPAIGMVFTLGEPQETALLVPAAAVDRLDDLSKRDLVRRSAKRKPAATPFRRDQDVLTNKRLENLPHEMAG
jgi:hypothetical protein